MSSASNVPLLARDSRPILLFGMPRSGTTWIAKIFDSHPRTMYRHEPDNWRHIRGVPLAPRLKDAGLFADALLSYIDQLPRFRSPKVSAKTPIFAKRYIGVAGRIGQAVGVNIAKVGGLFFRDFPVFGVQSRLDKEIRLVWKSIESLARLGVFAKVVPQSRAIHIIRNPCGFVASVLRGERARNFEYDESSSDDFGMLHLLIDTEFGREQRLDLTYLASLTPEERLAWRWLLVNEKAIRDCQNLKNVTVVKYDDLCLDPVGQSKRLFDFAGLEWTQQTQGFIETSTSRHGDGYYSVFKDANKAATKWRQELNQGQIDNILEVAKKGTSGKLFVDELSEPGLAATR